jgi:hypothetical protein
VLREKPHPYFAARLPFLGASIVRDANEQG